VSRKPEPEPFEGPQLGQVDDDPTIFDGLEKRGRRDRQRSAPLRAVAHGACPLCSNDDVGLARQGAHLAWKDHSVRTWGGISLQCHASGQRLCDLPARDLKRFTVKPTPTCSCGTN
jgi:hypothetical protein